MKKGILFVVILGVLLGGFSNALAYKKVKFRVFYPPSSPLPRSVESMAIMDFSGPDGDKFADMIIRHLLDDDKGTLNGNPIPQMRYFDIIERSRISSIMTEQNLSTTGMIDEASAAQFGKVAGVDAVFIGEISHHPKAVPTKQEYEDNQGHRYVENCITNSVSSSFNGRIIDVNTGQVLVAFDKGAFSGESKACGDSKKPTPHSTQIERNNISLMASIIRELTGDVGVRERELEKIKADEFEDKAKKAAEMSENGDIAGAYVIYQSQYDLDSYSDQSAYNLGVMHEAVGNYAKAKELYDLAVNLDSKNDDYSNAQRECAGTLDALLKAQETLQFEYPEYEFPVNAAALARATSATVVTDGGHDKRHEVFDGPDGGIMAKIPGGLELAVLQDEGAWIKIGLPDGKEGWMKEDSLDRNSLKDARK